MQLVFSLEINMKILHTTILALAIGVAAISSAQARDSFSFGLSIGNYGYAPPVAYYPQPVYYSQPVYYAEPVYYRPAPRAYYAPAVVTFGYQNYGGYRGHHDGWGRERHGWKHEGRGHDGGGWNRGRGHHDNDD
jgi:hypothetical protein